MPPLVELGTLVYGAWRYSLTPRDLDAGVALVVVEGGQSLDESRAVLGCALRRFALHKAWRSFADFVRAYEGGEPRPGSRRATIYADPWKRAPKAQQDMVRATLAGAVPLEGGPAEHWAAPTMFARLDASSQARFFATVAAAVRARNADWRFVDVPGTKPPRSNVFVSTWLSRRDGHLVSVAPP